MKNGTAKSAIRRGIKCNLLRPPERTKGKRRKFRLKSGLPEKEKPKSKAEVAMEILLDPFASVMLPGAYHFAFGPVFVLAGIMLSLLPVLKVFDVGRLNYLVIPLATMSFIFYIPFYLVMYGKKGALKILRSYVFSPIISYAVFFLQEPAFLLFILKSSFWQSHFQSPHPSFYPPSAAGRQSILK